MPNFPLLFALASPSRDDVVLDLDGDNTQSGGSLLVAPLGVRFNAFGSLVTVEKLLFIFEAADAAAAEEMVAEFGSSGLENTSCLTLAIKFL